MFSKVFSSLSSEYNFFDLFFVLPIRNLNPAFSQNMRRFGARLPKKERVFFQVISLTFGMGNKKGCSPLTRHLSRSSRFSFDAGKIMLFLLGQYPI